MLLRKNPRADLRIKYKRFLEISLILSLILLIAAFKYFPEFEAAHVYMEPSQDLITWEDIAHTKQNSTPPPLPKPAEPLVTLSNEIPEEIEFLSTDINDNPVVPLPPPPLARTIEIEEDFIPVAETMPELIGGIRGLQEKIIYPEMAVRTGVQGKVYIMAYVDEKGDVVKTELIKGIGGGCDEASLKAVSESKFSPGKQRGKPVKVKIAIPVVFKLNKS
ncbi:MAG: energy transducer TonB [Ignavibacteriaceae bacterium]